MSAMFPYSVALGLFKPSNEYFAIPIILSYTEVEIDTTDIKYIRTDSIALLISKGVTRIQLFHNLFPCSSAPYCPPTCNWCWYDLLQIDLTANSRWLANKPV